MRTRLTIALLCLAASAAGLAPGLVGIWQINAIVSTDAPVGSAVPLVIILGLRSNTLSVAVE